MEQKKILLASYGGGHCEIIKPVARACLKGGFDTHILGLTTAYSELQDAGFQPLSILELIESDDKAFLDIIRPFLPKVSHSRIPTTHTELYYCFGFRELCLNHGQKRALKILQDKGRFAFEPIAGMQRFLRKLRPDLVITTTSPRSELALLKAANRESIPSIAIGDLFLEAETWILAGDYADYLAVLSDAVAENLEKKSIKLPKIVVTGNPAFDSLAPLQRASNLRSELRKKLQIENKKIILWPLASSEKSMIGRPFISPSLIVNYLEEFCQHNSEFYYIVRPHPNTQITINTKLNHGMVGSLGLSADESILVADIVFVEASTLGLQAALLGRSVICIGHADFVIYPKYGLAKSVNTVKEALEYVCTENKETHIVDFGMPPLGSATNNVMNLVYEILENQEN